MARDQDDKPFWIKFEMDKWEGGVDGLTVEAEYVFFRLCRKMWSTGKPVLLEQFSSLIRHKKDGNVYLEELVRSNKVTISNGLIFNKVAISAHKEARKTLKENKKRTKKANEARRKQHLTPRKETENPPECDDTRNDNEYSTVQKKNSLNNSFPTTLDKNSNSQKSDEGKSDEGNKVGTLKADTYEAARRIAPGYDIYHIEERWRSSGFSAKAKKPGAAFLGFLKTHIKKNPL